jgi:glutaminyl-tRNA synthetase
MLWINRYPFGMRKIKRTGECAFMPDCKSDPQLSGGSESLDFLREIVRRDKLTGAYGGRVVTRFPPEPNGYLHIGHAKSICLNFGIAREFDGVCHLRFDDTNPETEDMKYVAAIIRDVRWLGFDWGEKLFFASDYFEQLYEFAVRLIRDGKAYVDSQTEDEIREHRGTVTEAGRESPCRGRSVEENLDLFARMRAGEFPDGAHVLRAKGDMAASNMKMRDPLLYRIRHATHYRRGDDWCLYPMYDFAHPLSDAVEKITHSICTLEFENNRAIYDWLLDNLFPEPRPHQYEFARLNLDYTIMSKRKLLELVEMRLVSGWDDPRLPTIAGMRRRGYTPEGIRLFAARIGVDKSNSRVSMDLLEDAIRDDLNARAPRVMAVLRPLKVTITNYPEGKVEWMEAPYWPRDIDREGSRKVPLSREVVIERTDFLEHPPADWIRLRPGGEVRLRSAYFIRCEEIIRDPATGDAIELRCTYDPDSLGKPAKGARKKTTAVQWVSASHAFPAEVRLYDRLFTTADPENAGEGRSFRDFLNPGSVEIVRDCLLEPGLAKARPGERFQFVRHGYFVADEVDSRPGAPVFNRIVELRDRYRQHLRKPD